MREISNNDRGWPTQESRESWTICEALDWAIDQFRAGGTDSSRFEAEELLAHALHIERLTLHLHPMRRLDDGAQSCFQKLIIQRLSGTPSAYLVGHVEFMKTTLRVNSNVLIPRPETEELVEKIAADFEKRGSAKHSDLTLLDLGTGSGAIAIALLLEWPMARAVAVDLSQEALCTAQRNAVANGVADRILFLHSDWTAAVSGHFDLVVSNPPYVPTAELETLPREVIDHEPRAALDGGSDGLTAIKRILRESPRLLRPGSPLYFEIGHNQGAVVASLLTQSQELGDWRIFPDLGGRDRIVQAYRRIH